MRHPVLLASITASILMMLMFSSASSAPGSAVRIGEQPTGQPAGKGDTEAVEKEVRQVFDVWSTALTKGDKKTYIDTFWDSPRLVIRVADGEWRGIEAYRKRIEGARLPPGNPAEYRNVQVVALGDGGAVVTYERPAPGQPTTTFRGTAVFIKTDSGWKIAAWQADAITAQTK
ncbi:MAG TPA: AtzH-like domain-containing protein [Blastocatellia bacterium]